MKFKLRYWFIGITAATILEALVTIWFGYQKKHNISFFFQHTIFFTQKKPLLSLVQIPMNLHVELGLFNLFKIMSKYIQQKKWIIALILAVFCNNPIFPQHIQQINSLGDIWIVTIDKSGSMLNSRGAAKIASEIYLRLGNIPYLDKIDYTKDRFLFFTSGYSWDEKIGLGNEISKAPRFDTCFIHNTDNQLHSFEDKNALKDKIKDIVAENNYFHKLSFVSQIRVFSIVKAVAFLKSKNESNIYQSIKIINITDDADINDQWLTDYKNLKKWAPNKVEEIGSITSKYIYNVLNGRGYGNLEEVFADEKTTPHIWIYSYTTKQSLAEIAESQKYFKISALNGETIDISSLIDDYKNEKILFFRLDSIEINESKYLINQIFDSFLNLDLDYENDFAKNQIQLYGSFQVQYIDSILGEHYKKYYFSQSEYLPTSYRAATFSKIEITLTVLLLVFLIYWILVLPNKNLLVIYSNQGKKYIIKRGYKHHWKKGTIPILSSILNENNLSVICKKQRNIKTKPFLYISDSKNSFLICSNHKLFSDETIEENNITFKNTQIDIEDYYNARSGKYPELLKKIYNKTAIFKCRKNLYNSDKKIIRVFGNLLLKICNRLYTKYYYAIPIKTNKNLPFRHNTLKNCKFTIEFKENSIKTTYDENSQFNIYCLNQYYDETPNERYDTIICCGLTSNKIFWNVLLPEYDKNDRVSLRFVYNTYQYVQILTEETERQISYNFKLLQKEVKKNIKNGGKIKEYKINSMADYNPHNFEITEVSYPGFLYLIEDTAEQKSQRLYSPFKDGSKEKIDVFVKKFKTQNCHLYLSFLPPNPIKDNTLTTKLSNELIIVNENSDAVLEIKNKKKIIFKNINTSI